MLQVLNKNPVRGGINDGPQHGLGLLDLGQSGPSLLVLPGILQGHGYLSRQDGFDPDLFLRKAIDHLRLYIKHAQHQATNYQGHGHLRASVRQQRIGHMVGVFTHIIDNDALPGRYMNRIDPGL